MKNLIMFFSALTLSFLLAAPALSYTTGLRVLMTNNAYFSVHAEIEGNGEHENLVLEGYGGQSHFFDEITAEFLNIRKVPYTVNITNPYAPDGKPICNLSLLVANMYCVGPFHTGPQIAVCRATSANSHCSVEAVKRERCIIAIYVHDTGWRPTSPDDPDVSRPIK